MVAPSCSALSFRLISRAHFWPGIHLTSGKDGISHSPRGCETICLCHLAGEEKDDWCCIATCLLLWCSLGLWHGANWTFVAWGAYHGLLLVGYRLFDRATVGTAIDRVMKKRWFVPFSVGADVCGLCVKRAFLPSEDSPDQRICLKCAIRFPACNRRIPAHDRHDRAHFHFSVSGCRAGTQPVY